MSGEDLHPATEWELPAGMFIAGIVILSAGLSNNIWGVCCAGLLMLLVASFWIIKIRVKKLDPSIKESTPRNDFEKLDKHNHSNHFHL